MSNLVMPRMMDNQIVGGNGRSCYNGARKIGNIPSTPGTRSGVEPSSTATSRGFQPDIEAGQDVVIPANCTMQYKTSLDTETAGTVEWPAGEKYCRVTGPASADYDTSITHTFTFNGVDVDFIIITTADPVQAILAQDGEGILLQDGDTLII